MDKAIILKAGTVTPEGKLEGDWNFDCLGNIPGFSIKENEILYAGYTIEELREIAEKQ
jgi:hypothetical protein